MFLFKPHVTGPEGAITTPDVIIDALFVDGAKQPLSRLTQQAWQEAEETVTTRAAYALTALGGGALISPALVVSDGLVIVARSGWRLANLDRHIGAVTLNGRRLADLAMPADLINAAGGTEDALPRGFMLLQTAPGDTAEAVLADGTLGRELTHRAHFTPIGTDRWGDARPKPRYSVGPIQKDVPHFI